MDKINKIYSILLSWYGPQGWWPVGGKYHPGDYSYPKTQDQKLEICAGAILTQNTTWKNVEKALSELKKYKLLSIQKIRRTDAQKLARIIHSSGYHNQKARKLKTFCDYSGEITRENLLRLWGIGKETADSILLYAHRQPVFVVDAYTRRLMSRLGICDEDISYDDLQAMFHAKLGNDHKLFNEFHALIVKHSVELCRKRTPGCSKCPLIVVCRYGKNNAQEI